jgi:hypothetical protein
MKMFVNNPKKKWPRFQLPFRPFQVAILNGTNGMAINL